MTRPDAFQATVIPKTSRRCCSESAYINRRTWSSPFKVAGHSTQGRCFRRLILAACRPTRPISHKSRAAGEQYTFPNIGASFTTFFLCAFLVLRSRCMRKSSPTCGPTDGGGHGRGTLLSWPIFVDIRCSIQISKGSFPSRRIISKSVTTSRFDPRRRRSCSWFHSSNSLTDRRLSTM